MVSATVEVFLPGPVVLEWHQLVEICTTVDHGFLVNGNALAVFAAFEYLVQCRLCLCCGRVQAVSKAGAAGAAGAGSGLTGAGAASWRYRRSQCWLFCCFKLLQCRFVYYGSFFGVVVVIIPTQHDLTPKAIIDRPRNLDRPESKPWVQVRHHLIPDPRH